ncbi:TlpA family protein disulfide reductase [Candidatus Neomarinimicrobiota bacterium]
MRNLGILALALLMACSLNPSKKNSYRIELSPGLKSDYEMYHGGGRLVPSSPSGLCYEPIGTLRDKFTVTNTYSICLQSGLQMYEKLCESVEYRERYFEQFTDNTFEDLQAKYTADSLDHIVSLCVVEDSSGNEFIIFDRDNDEDLTNDPLVAFETLSYYNEFADSTIEFTCVESDVQFEYYEGSETRDGTFRIRVSKPSSGPPDWLVQTAARGHFGRLRLDGEKYLVGLINMSSDVECTKYDALWVDWNRNRRYDALSDLYQQMYLPFTLGQKSYRVTEVDRFGESVMFVECDPDSIPPIGIGLPAPGFTETTIDSVEFAPGDFDGQLVMLDFWTCSGSLGLSFTNAIHQAFKDDPRVGIVSFGPHRPQYLSPELKAVQIEWPHIHGLTEVATRNLYQVGGLHTTFLIDPEGIIIARKVFAEEKDIIDLISENVD